MSKAINILKGKFPEEPFSLDQQVQIVNEAGDILAERLAGGESIDDACNNLFLWLGGTNKDIQLYACQYIFNLKKIEFDADEKTEARLTFMEPYFTYGGSGYVAISFQTIDHRPWPKEYLSTSTFEERLDELPEAKEQIEFFNSLPTADQIINGTDHPVTTEIPLSSQYAITTSISYALKASWEKYGKVPNVVMDDQLVRANQWVNDHLIYDMKILFWKTTWYIFKLKLKDGSKFNQMGISDEDVSVFLN